MQMIHLLFKDSSCEKSCIDSPVLNAIRRKDAVVPNSSSSGHVFLSDSRVLPEVSPSPGPLR